MRLLLDTHVFLWAINDDPRLSRRARTLMSTPDASLFFSIVSLWEIAIKYARRRGRPNDMPISAEEAIRHLAAAQCEILALTPSHVTALGRLPAVHGDPFDRMLIAQARAEPLRLLTADPEVAAYGEPVERV